MISKDLKTPSTHQNGLGAKAKSSEVVIDYTHRETWTNPDNPCHVLWKVKLIAEEFAKSMHCQHMAFNSTYFIRQPKAGEKLTAEWDVLEASSTKLVTDIYLYANSNKLIAKSFWVFEDGH